METSSAGVPILSHTWQNTLCYDLRPIQAPTRGPQAATHEQVPKSLSKPTPLYQIPVTQATLFCHSGGILFGPNDLRSQV